MSHDLPRYAVGTLVGLAGALLFAEPLVGAITLGPVAVRPVALSVGVLALGLSLGGILFLSRGQWLVGVAHAIPGVGFAVVFGATALGSETGLLFGVAVVLGACLALADGLRRER